MYHSGGAVNNGEGYASEGWGAVQNISVPSSQLAMNLKLL